MRRPSSDPRCPSPRPSPAGRGRPFPLSPALEKAPFFPLSPAFERATFSPPQPRTREGALFPLSPAGGEGEGEGAPSEQINDGEQDYPDEIHEVPVQTERLDSLVVLLSV